MESARQVWNRLHDLLSSSLTLIQHLAELPINSNVDGFQSSIPLWQLSTLTRDDPIWDDLVSGRLEVAQLVSAYLGKKIFFFTPAFVDSLVTEFISSGSGGIYSSSVASLRNHILQTGCDGIGMIRCLSAHYDGFVWDATHTLHYANSMLSSDVCNLTSAASLIPVLNWLLEDLEFPVITELAVIPTDQQALGTNPCALAAVNSIEHFLCLTDAVWTPELSSLFRDCWLFDFVLLNHVFSNMPVCLLLSHNR